jgi:hypothetical protein
MRTHTTPSSATQKELGLIFHDPVDSLEEMVLRLVQLGVEPGDKCKALLKG